jgi:TolA-binding protein
MQKKLASLLLCTITGFCNEISVFGAGNLDSKEPYGLTTTEKHIVQNKTAINSLDSSLKGLKSSFETISQRIDGLESVYEGDGKKLNDTVIKLNELTQQSQLHENEIKTVKEVTTQILQIQEENSKSYNENLDKLKKAIDELAKVVNNINNEYISQKEFKSNMEQFVTKKEFDALKKELLNQTTSSNNKTNNTTKSNSEIPKEYANLSNAELLEKAKELFRDDFFTPAIPIFEYLIKNHYKPAESNFYLGEIWYYRKQYNDAIRHYKESAMLYDKASYMPKLLLHSAISFENTSDYENAASFYTTLINSYPDSTEAQTANKNLSQLN